VAGQYHLIEAFHTVITCDRRPAIVAPNRTYRAVQPFVNLPVATHRANVRGRAATHHAPFGSLLRLQHLVIRHELNEWICVAGDDHSADAIGTRCSSRNAVP
jgi:hypothetical protein